MIHPNKSKEIEQASKKRSPEINGVWKTSNARKMQEESIKESGHQAHNKNVGGLKAQPLRGVTAV